MLCVDNVTKRFGNTVALSGLSLCIPDGCVYGLVGSNGAGKSTLLRCISGIYRPDSGQVTLDDKPLYDNPDAKRRFVFVPDDLYFLRNATMAHMENLYTSVYPAFDVARCHELCERFRLPQKAPIRGFSKGMRRLASTALALAAKTDIVLFDETMDGLDPIMRHIVKSVIAEEISDRGLTAVVVSHSLRELEDMCDHLALLHEGGIVLQSDVVDLKTSLCKVQISLPMPFDKNSFSGVDIVHYHQSGSVATLIARGERDEISTELRTLQPLLLDVLPLSLEEVFTFELQAKGYDFHALTGGETA